MKLVITLLFIVNLGFSCPGGSVTIADEQIVLTADSINYQEKFLNGVTKLLVRNDLDGFQKSTLALYSSQKTANVFVENEKASDLVSIRVAYVKKDHGGIIYTIFEVTTIHGGEGFYESKSSVKYIKVESNYFGNGMRSRSPVSEPEFDISESYGC